MEKHILIRMSILNCNVCSEGSEEDALAWLRMTSPAGTSNNWGKYDYAEDPEMAPMACESHPERTHYMFCC